MTDPGDKAQRPGKEPTSAQMIEAARGGASAAWSGLEARYRGRLLALADVVLGTKTRRLVSPEDIVQEAWLNVARLTEFEYRDRDCLYRFLAKQVRHRAIDWARRQKTRDFESPDNGRLDGHPDTADTPSAVVQYSEEWRGLAAALMDARLARPYAEILVEHYLEGRPLGVIAAERPAPLNSIQQLVSRARRRLQELHSDLGELLF